MEYLSPSAASFSLDSLSLAIYAASFSACLSLISKNFPIIVSIFFLGLSSFIGFFLVATVFCGQRLSADAAAISC
jgi:hypothetical protein